MRVSISTIGFCALLVGLDFAVLRYVPTNDRTWLDFIALPSANILAFAFYRFQTLRRRGESSPFLFGFQIAGWAAMSAYLGLCRVWPRSIGFGLASSFDWVRRRTMDNLDFETMRRLDSTNRLTHVLSTFAMAIIIAGILTGAMLLAAIGGGMIARRRLVAGRGSSSL